MKKTQFLRIVGFFLAILFLVKTTHADLNLLGQGTSTYGTYNLIYDTDLDITWLDTNNPADTWANQMSWVSGLSVDFGGIIYNNWRLPASPYDGPENCIGYDCTQSEMGHLFYTKLGHTAGSNVVTYTGVFQNLTSAVYWSGTDYLAPDRAMQFGMNDGFQTASGKMTPNNHHNGLAVMDGLAVVPEPISSLLFITGGAILAGRRLIRKKIRT